MADKKISALTAASTPLAGTEVLPIVQSGTTKKTTILDATNGLVVTPSKVGLGVTPDRRLVAASDGVNWMTGVFFGSGGADNVVIGNLSDTPTIGGHNTAYNAWKNFAVSGSTIQFQINGFTKATLKASGNYAPEATLGIDFSANTPAAGMTSQLLNWYEEGTWTPVVVGSSSAGTGTYSAQSGYYTRIGRQVTVLIELAWSAHTGTGNLLINGLPFTSANTVPPFGVAVAYDLALTAGNTLTCRAVKNSTQIELLQTPTGGGAWNSVPIDTNVVALEINLTYFV